MKTVIMIVMALVLAAMYGCQSSSPRGGSVLEDKGFKIEVPTLATEIKQGEVQSITISLERDKYFKQDVKLQIEAAKGIIVDPTSIVVRASDQAEVPLSIAVTKNAAIGEYRISVKGIPKTGESTSTVFNIKVVVP